MSDRSDDLVVQRREGLYCPPGDFYIDPWRPVERAVITHAHGDHARRGHAPLPRRGAGRRRAAHAARRRDRPADAAVRRGDRPPRRAPQPASRRPRARLGAGAARARRPGLGRLGRLLRRRRSADAREDNATCAPFEPVRCHCFITESTFGLPIYRWQPQAELFADDQRLVARATPRPAAPACCSATASARRSASCTGVDRVDRADRRARRGRAAEPRLPRRRRRIARRRRWSPRSTDKALFRRALSSRRRRRRARPGRAASATTATPSPAAGCSCAARAGAARSTAASSSATTPTGPACSAPSPPPAPSASSSPTATRR